MGDSAHSKRGMEQGGGEGLNRENELGLELFLLKDKPGRGQKTDPNSEGGNSVFVVLWASLCLLKRSFLTELRKGC